jgi:zinc transporter ZupT
LGKLFIGEPREEGLMDYSLSRAFLLAAITFFTALIVGIIPLWKKISEQENVLKWMTGLAAGVLLASALLVAIPEGFEIASGAHSGGVDSAGNATSSEGFTPLMMGGSILLGFLFMLILEAFGFGHDLHEEHHDHGHSHGHDHVHHPNNPSSIIFGLCIHALTDGMAIGAALASRSMVLTLSIFLGVIIHKLPAAFSVGVFSMHERSDRNKTIKDVLLFSLAAPIMIIAAYFLLGGVDEQYLGLAILFSGGTFLYVATVDVLPDVHNSETGKLALIQVIIGAMIMTTILIIMDLFGIIGH